MILLGDCLSVLRTLPENSVHCVVTSPPYWGLRDYGTATWHGGDPDCDHTPTTVKEGRNEDRPMLAGSVATNAGQVKFWAARDQCERCGARKQDRQLGLERTPEEYVSNMVAVFAEVRRVLRPEGICWLNIGDCYAANRSYQVPDSKHVDVGNSRAMSVPIGLKPKDLVGIPWLLAFALRADGWYLRSEIIWAKGISFCESYAGSVMPESVNDRPTRGHEQIFLLTKNQTYFYDQWAVKEKGVYPPGTLAAKGSGTREGNRRGTTTGRGFGKEADKQPDGRQPQQSNSGGYAVYDGTRNLRTVWAIGVEPFSEAHFATFPPDLVYPCIKAGTSEHGVCAACGSPYKRLVEQEEIPDDVKQAFADARARTADDHGRTDGFTTHKPNYQRKTTGERWERTCTCASPDTVPATVLDPFSGAGTVGVVCERMQRRYLGIELNPSYIALSERRIAAVAPLFGEIA